MHHGAGHAARQPGPAGRRLGAAGGPSADPDHDGQRRVQRRGFRLFRLRGYRFSPRLADVGGTRCWRITRRPTTG
jgi:glycine/D-amino acid oxidase-like deaminating enzyme